VANFRPGNQASHSGGYKVIHAEDHAPPHHITVLVGEAFPLCLQCSDQVTFELFVSAVHVNEHPMFVTPRNRPTLIILMPLLVVTVWIEISTNCNESEPLMTAGPSCVDWDGGILVNWARSVHRGGRTRLSDNAVKPPAVYA
jgi:hypothetical protein